MSVMSMSTLRFNIRCDAKVGGTVSKGRFAFAFGGYLTCITCLILDFCKENVQKCLYFKILSCLLTYIYRYTLLVLGWTPLFP